MAPRTDRRRVAATLLGVALCLGVVVALGLMAGTPGRGRPAEVELLVYSGRPNPGFALTAAEADDLRRRLADLPPGPAGSEPPGLGYGGVAVTFAGAGPDRVTVYGGTVTLQTADEVATRRDTAAVEAWLLDLARRHGYADLLAGLGQ